MKLLVVQPYLAGYRKPFWTEALAHLSRSGVECTLAFGQPDQSFSRRGDQVSLPGAISTPNRSLKIGGPVVRWQSSWRHWHQFDAVVLEASGGLLDASVATLGRKPTGLWGHIDEYTGAGNPIDARIERWQLRRATSVLAYTKRGAEAAVQRGVDADRVTVLNNTVATAELVEAATRMTRAEADDVLGTAGWDVNETFCFIGGVDVWKRIDFLVDALDLLWARRPSIRLIVGGQGDQEGLLDAAVRRGQVTMLGRVNLSEKAAMAQVCNAILMPGRVGLVAVDSFALGLPILTTDYPLHAPEYEYLEPGSDSLVTADSVEEYAAGVLSYAEDPALASRLRKGASAKAGWPELEQMAANFTAGCLRLFD